MLNYLYGVSTESIYEAHRAWGERFSEELWQSEGPAWDSWANSKASLGQITVT